MLYENRAVRNQVTIFFADVFAVDDNSAHTSVRGLIETMSVLQEKICSH